MPILVRTRNEGKTYELRVTHKLLEKPFFRTFTTQHEAERVGVLALAELDKGTVPAWMLKVQGTQTIAAGISQYRMNTAVPYSQAALLDTLVEEIGSTKLLDVGNHWAEEWIRSLKVNKQNAPGTIRKKKGALSRVFAWVVVKRPLWLVANPLADLPHGYSGYDEHSRSLLHDEGLDVPEDEERDRRISPEEESRILAVLRRRVADAATDEARAVAEGYMLMFQLALTTAMRMREIYTLVLGQVSLEMRTIFLSRSKTGNRREVPLSSKAQLVLNAPWPALESVRKDGRLFPFWDGSLDKSRLTEITRDLSAEFDRIFEEAGCPDLHFHDTRHEAVCRWVLEAPVPLTSEQLGRAAGMKDARTRQRYLSLRGSELANFLG